MTFALFLDQGGPVAAVRSPVIKASDVADFTSALALLAEARARAAAIERDADAARQAAQTDGFSAGLATAQAQIEQQLVAVATAFSNAEAARREEIAAAAYAAVRAIIGSFADDDLVSRVAMATLARTDHGGPAVIEVAPALAERVRERIGSNDMVSVVGSPALAGCDCHISFGQGKIIASVDGQLAALAARWGVEA